MLNNFLLSIAIIAQVTGLTLPQILVEEDFYLIPTLDDQNQIVVDVDPVPGLPIKDPAPEKITTSMGPNELQAWSAIAVDKNSGEILWQKNAQTVFSIASITKLMTALVFLDHNPGWDHMHKMASAENWLIGARLAAGEGEEFSTFDLFRTTLVGSRNNATLALAHSTEISDEVFKDLMDEKAQMLGMKDSSFYEPTGLEEENRSTAQDLARLARAAFARQEIIEPMQMEYHEMKRKDSDEVIRVKNTNKLIKDTEVKVIAGKTGYTEEAGFCLLALAENEWGNEIIIAVLGVPDDNQRFAEAKEIIQWIFENYNLE